jgi:DNA polymerase-3 subunit alpha
MFANLRTHSQYSIIDGLMKPAEIISLAAADGQSSIALTDNARMFGAIDFYENATKKGVKPIIGVDAWIESDVTSPDTNASSRILLLAQDSAGYKRLMELVSRANLENTVSDVARIKQSWLVEGCESIIALSGGREGEIEKAIASDDPARAASVLDQYRRWFGDRFYLEVQRAGFDGEQKLVQGLVDLSAASQVPLVATHPVQFAKREDFLAHEVKYCVVNGEMVYDLQRPRHFTAEQYFHTEAQMRELFSDLPEAVDNAALVAARCSPNIQLGKSHLPHFPTEDGSSENEAFANLARAGLEKRLEAIFPDAKVRAEKRSKYDARLELEVETIRSMGFPGYYLIVADFIQWSKDNGVPVGPGRGSGAGSLAAYALNITDIDPLPYDLLFERFLNPERVSMPDFDIDFCEERRDEVIDYVRQKYGEESVGRIATYGQLKAKAAIKGAGRALGMPYMMTDELSKMIVSKPGTDISIEEALEQFPKLAERYEKMPDVRELVDLARSIENSPQSVGMHAGGVLISPGKMTDFSPLYLGDVSKGGISQYDKDMVERAGLVKFDFLGLGTLTVLDKAVRLINSRADYEGKTFSLPQIPLDDPAVYKQMSKGDTIAVFQFESGGMRELLKNAKPDRFEDLIALVSLFRPGPMDLIPDFVDRKHGRKDVSYPHPTLEPVLSATYGVIIYQEQVMQIAQVMGGYSLGGADLLRRAMGKKDVEKMAKERSKFEAGAQKNGVDAKLATEIFDLMEKFAGYGFNKSHAAAYALIAYHTAWIKKNYPAEFYAANMSVKRNDNDALANLVDDARRHGLKILPPDINDAGTDFTPSGNNGIRFSFSGVKGVGDSAARKIMQIRVKEGKFTSMMDFCTKVSGSGVNKTTVEALVRAGAFDSLHPNRAQAMAAVPLGLKYASDLLKAKTKSEQQSSANPAQGSLLPSLGSKKKAPAKARAVKQIVEPEMPVVEAWPEVQKLDEERRAVGFFLSGHPYHAYAKRFDGLPSALPLEKIDQITPGYESHLVAGMVIAVNEKPNRNREKQAKVILDDGRASREVTFFARTWAEVGNRVKAGQFMALEAKITADSFRGEGVNQIVAENVFSADQLQDLLANRINVAIAKADMPRLAQVLSEHGSPDGLQVTVYIPDGEDRYFRADLADVRLAKTPEAKQALIDVVGADRVKFGYSNNFKFESKRRFNNGPRRR